MSSGRFAIKAAALCGTLIPVGCVIAAVAAFDLYHASSIEKQTKAISTAASMTVIAEASSSASAVAALGWQRVVPVALLGFLAAQWVQQARQRDTDDQSM
jgi:non-ribosomal peptide synthetase component E (peptide arylation enzyme)